MTIYGEHALSYLKKGYSVIPDKQGTKAPAIEGWTELSDRMPTIDEVRQWSSIPSTNIALMLGESSGIIALDLDTDDSAVLSKISHLLPDSPVERKGSKGFVRLFKYNGEQNQELFDYYEEEGITKKRMILELLSTGKKVTLPPSIHPLKMYYIWTKQSLLDIDRSSLPDFPSGLFEVLREKLGINHSLFKNKAKISGGRNSNLSSYCSELIRDQVDIDTAVQKLIKYDLDFNNPPYFSDEEEHKSNLSLINAMKFFSTHLESINIKRDKAGLLPELPISITADQELPEVEEVLKPSLKEMPKPTGLLKKISDYILSCSYVEQPIFALDAALVLIGGLVSRKVIFRGSTPNLYILNVASSGSGKDSCQQAIKRLLKASKSFDLIGASSYPSEASIMCNLETQPSRIDIIDEASSFLRSATKGGAAYQTGIGDILCELYTSANEDYLGKVLASQGGKRVGRCSRPHLNILCSTTFKGVSEGISQATLEKGLFARFLTFFGDDSVPSKQIKNPVAIPKDLVENLNYWQGFSNPLETGNFDLNKQAYNLSISPEADNLIDLIHPELDKLRTEQKASDIMRPIVSRLFQQMLKLVLLSAVSNTPIGKLPKVDVIDVRFGYDMIMYFYQNIQEFVNNSLHDDDRSAKLNKLKRFIKSHGEKGVDTVEITKFGKGIGTRERMDILKDLRESEEIILQKVVRNNKEVFVFIYIGKE